MMGVYQVLVFTTELDEITVKADEIKVGKDGSVTFYVDDDTIVSGHRVVGFFKDCIGFKEIEYDHE